VVPTRVTGANDTAASVGWPAPCCAFTRSRQYWKREIEIPCRRANPAALSPLDRHFDTSPVIRRRFASHDALDRLMLPPAERSSLRQNDIRAQDRVRRSFTMEDASDPDDAEALLRGVVGSSTIGDLVPAGTEEIHDLLKGGEARGELFDGGGDVPRLVESG
jgi:hypothetical protein